ncbi:MAG: cyanophycinase [Nocardioides sp.]
MPKGPLMIIGGAEDKLRKRTILREFVAAAGGPAARIAVIPTASSLGPEVSEVYDALFRREGAADVIAVRPESRAEAHDRDLVATLGEVTGVFMTGGNQLKLSAIICGTPLGNAVVAAHRRGVVVAGTSAGASIQSSHMLAFGGPGSTPKQRMTQMAAGLGLIDSAVIDQHFDQRNRYGRLLMIVAQSPQLLGIGVDEDTAAVVEHTTVAGTEGHEVHEILRVVGRGAVTILDPARITTNAFEAKRSAPILASGVVLHLLPDGSAFDLTTRTLLPRGVEITAEDAAGIADAERDLRQMARDIAAADASPSALKRRLRSRRKPARVADHPADHPDGVTP